MVAIVVLNVITWVVMIGIIIAGPYIKKITNNYFFWMILGALLLVYLIIGRFNDSWQGFIKYGNDNGIDTSRAFFLDICPLCAFALCIFCIIDPTRKIAKTIAPFGIYGGLITILMIEQVGPSLTAQFIFLGDDAGVNPMYFMMHFINVELSILILVSTPKMRFSDWIYCNLFAGIYYSYVAIVMTTLGVQNNVSGLNINDWRPNGEYGGVANTFGLSPGAACALGFIFSYAFISLLIFLDNRLQKFKRYRWYDVWNKKQWFIGWYQLSPPANVEESDSLLFKMYGCLRNRVHKRT